MHYAFPPLYWVCFIANYSASVADVLSEPDKLRSVPLENINKKPNLEIIATCLNFKNVVYNVKELKCSDPHS